MGGDADNIRKTLGEHHDGNYGYVVYRCVYGNDKQWEDFIARLTEYVNVSQQWSGDDLSGCFKWTIMEDESKYKDATKDEIRRAFREWCEAVAAGQGMVKYRTCIYADQEVVDAVLNGEYPQPNSVDEIENPRAYVKLIRRWFDLPSLHEDDGYPLLDGLRVEQVGWMKVAARLLGVRAYSKLRDDGWHRSYVRPPAIWNE